MTNIDFSRRGRVPLLPAILALGLAVLIFGCGGGGGGGSSAGASTAGSTNAGSTNAGSTNAGSTNGSAMGPLPPDKIIYAEYTGPSDSAFDIKAISGDGTGDVFVAQNVPAVITSVAISQTTPLTYVFAANNANGDSGLYKNSTLSLTGATTLIAPPSTGTPTNPVGRVISYVQLTPDGKTVVFNYAPDFNTVDSVETLPIAGGTPTVIDTGSQVSLSPDGTTVVYGKSVTNFELFTAKLSGGAPTQITTAASDFAFPQWSKDGKTIIASVPDANSVNGLVTVSATGANLTVLNNSTGLDETSASPNGDGSQIAVKGFYFVNGSTTQNGIYRVGADGKNLSLVKPSIQLVPGALYWTTLQGRGAGGPGFSMNFGTRRKHR